jgi:O-antigen/teichoic acid export membrane protein
MIGRAFKDSALYIASIILTRGLNVILLPLYTKILTPSDYGNIDMLYTVAAVVNLVLALEVTQAIARFLPDFKLQSERVESISSAYWFTLGVYAVFLVVMVTFQPVLHPLIFSSDTSFDTYLAGLLAISAQGPFNYLTNLLKWSLKAKQNAAVNLLTSIIILSISIPTVLFFNWGITGIFVGSFVGNTIGGLLSWYIMRHDIKMTFSWSRLKHLLRYSSPLVISGAAIFVSLYTDRVLLKYFHDTATVGLYGIAYRFASIVHLFLFGLQSGITPLILTQYQSPETPAKIEQLFRYYLLLMAITVLGLMLFSKEILVLFTAPEYYAAYSSMALLALALFLSNSYFLAPGLNIERKTKLMAIVSISSALLNFILNLLVIPAYSTVGAAFATAIAGGLVLVCYFVLNQKYYPLPLRVSNYSRFGVLVIIVAAGFLWSDVHFSEAFEISYVNVVIKVFALGLISLIIFFTLFSVTELRAAYDGLSAAVRRMF